MLSSLFLAVVMRAALSPQALSMGGPALVLLSPSPNTNLCLAPTGGLSAGVGATLSLQDCETTDMARFWSWAGTVGAAPANAAALVWEANTALCADVGTNPTIATTPTLQACSATAPGPQWKRQTASSWAVNITGSFFLGLQQIVPGAVAIVEPGPGAPSWTTH